MSTHPLMPSEDDIFHDPIRMALTLFQNGYYPLWLRLGTKIPGFDGWLQNLPTEESLRRDFKRPGNIGIIQGVVTADKTFAVTIDIDQNDHPLVSYVERAIGDDCPKKLGKKGMSFLVRGVGNISSQTLHDYRGGTKKPAGDILAKGKQTVIPPSIHPETKVPYQWCGKMTLLNTKYDALPIITNSVIKEIRAFLRDPSNAIAQLNDMTWKGVGGGGDTHDTCVAAVASMVRDEWAEDEIHARIRRAKREASERAGESYHWPAETKVCQEWIDSAREKGYGAKTKKKAKPSHGELADFVLAQHSSIIKRDKASRDWYVYNGKFWEAGATEQVKTLIRQCLADDQIFRSTIDGVEAVLRLYPEVTVESELWDKDTHYLNCPAGTVNLKTRQILPHDPAHLITKMCRVSPRFDFENSLWTKAVSTWFGGIAAEIEYVQTLFGLFLTGETRDECVAMWIGKSGAGKSKMTEIVSHVMGDYAQTATDTAFLEVRYHPHQEEIARMRGKRLIFIHEVEGHLNLRRVKSIASGEATSASFKGKDSFEFKPQAKIWFVGNEAAPTKSSGRELKRRFHVYEFTRQIDEKDMDVNLKEKLQAEAEHVLGWMIEGAKMYYDRGGLTRSPHVIESTSAYFTDADIMEQFLEEDCVVEAHSVTSVADLFEGFDAWSDDARIRFKLDKGRFASRMKAKGFALERRVLVKGQPAVRVIVGVRLRPEVDRRQKYDGGGSY